MKHDFRTMHLFAGVGGGILADYILGHTPIIAVEWDKYACRVLRDRVADGWFDGMSVWEGDVREFAAHDYKGRVDCVHAGFPCQDISLAGNQAGVGTDSRSGLYREVLRIADEVRPQYIFLENVSAIVTGDDGGWLRTVAGDIASRGYDAVWTCLSASEVGANHKRDRWWLLAFPKSQPSDGTNHHRENSEPQIQESGNSSSQTDVGNADMSGHGTFGHKTDEKWQKTDERWQEQSFSESSRPSEDDVSNAISEGLEGRLGDSSGEGRQDLPSVEHDRREVGREIGCASGVSGEEAVGDSEGERVQGFGASGQQEPQAHARPELPVRSGEGCYPTYWSVEPDVGRVVNGLPNRAHRLKGLGNAQVPLQCAAAFEILWEIMQEKAPTGKR